MSALFKQDELYWINTIKKCAHKVVIVNEDEATVSSMITTNKTQCKENIKGMKMMYGIYITEEYKKCKNCFHG